MAKREQIAEIFRAQHPELYTGQAEVHLTIAGMMQNYNKKFSEMRTSNMYKLSGLKIYPLTSVKGFDGENRQLCKYNMFRLIN